MPGHLLFAVLLFCLAVLNGAFAQAESVLTFDIQGARDWMAIPQDYGDRVTAAASLILPQAGRIRQFTSHDVGSDRGDSAISTKKWE